MKKLTTILLFTTLNFSLLTFNSYSQWYQVNLPVSGQIQQVQFVNPSTGWIMVKESAVKFTLLKTMNGGINWTQTFSDSAKLMKFQFLTDSLGYGIGMYNVYDLLLKTTNSGYNWTVMQSTTEYVFGGFYFINSDTGYINGFNMSYYTFRTTNGLQTIELISSGAGGNPASIWFSKYPYNNQLCGYISGGGTLWKTINSGYNWSQIGFSNYISNYSFINKDTGWVVQMSSPRQILRTTNGGINWISQYSDPTGVLSPSNIFALDKHNIWSGIENYYYKIIRTTNSGTNWGNQNCQIPWPQVVYMYDSALGFAWNNFSVNNLARTTNGGGPILPVNKISEEVPVNYELSQNYPNPFNPSTTIEFNLPKQSTVSLQIFDVLGRKVSDLISSAEYGPGAYRMNIDFSDKNLSGGIYLCRFTAYQKNSGKTTAITKKMLMIK